MYPSVINGRVRHDRQCSTGSLVIPTWLYSPLYTQTKQAKYPPGEEGWDIPQYTVLGRGGGGRLTYLYSFYTDQTGWRPQGLGVDGGQLKNNIERGLRRGWSKNNIEDRVLICSSRMVYKLFRKKWVDAGGIYKSTPKMNEKFGNSLHPYGKILAERPDIWFHIWIFSNIFIQSSLFKRSI